MSQASNAQNRGLEVVLTGTFDVRNYGDLVFPLIAAHRLGPYGIGVRPASPTGCATGWRDAMTPAPLVDALFGPAPYDGVLIGGGNIVHARKVNLPDYVKAGAEQWAYGALWQEATLAACQRKVPVVWNAPGVPQAFDPAEQPTLEAVLAAASYVAVRDDASAQFVLPFRANVVPDTVLGLADLWPKSTLEADFRELLARKGARGDRPFVAIHVKERSMDGPDRGACRPHRRFQPDDRPHARLDRYWPLPWRPDRCRPPCRHPDRSLY